MPHHICKNCGTQHAESDNPPTECAICQDERQYVGWDGQHWTTLAELRRSHENTVRLEELGLLLTAVQNCGAGECRGGLILQRTDV